MQVKFGDKYLLRNNNPIVQSILIFLFIIVHGAWFYQINDMKFRYVIVVVSLVIMLLIPRTRNTKILFILALCVVMSFCNEIIFSGIGGLGNNSRSILHFVEPVLLTLVAYNYNKKEFCNLFLKWMFLLSSISLFFFLIGTIASDLLINSSLFHEVEMNRLHYTNFYCNFFYVLRDRELYRNVGIFTEPGLYQPLLTTCIVLLLFNYKDVSIKHKYVMLAVFIITLVTTGSATGYIAFAIIIVCFILSNGNINKTFKQAFIFTLMILMGYIVYDFVVNDTDSFIYQYLIDKIINIGSDELTTGSVRMQTIEYTINLLIHNPIGYGYSYVLNYASIYAPEAVGAKILFSTAAIGLFPIIILLAYLFKCTFKNALNSTHAIMIILLFINTALAQARSFFPALLILMLINNKNKVANS